MCTHLKEEIFSPELIKVPRVYDEDAVVEDVAEGGHDDERPPPVGVGPGPGEDRVHDGGDGLDQTFFL